jgi:hypothetical protein
MNLNINLFIFHLLCNQILTILFGGDLENYFLIRGFL